MLGIFHRGIHIVCVPKGATDPRQLSRLGIEPETSPPRHQTQPPSVDIQTRLSNGVSHSQPGRCGISKDQRSVARGHEECVLIILWGSYIRSLVNSSNCRLWRTPFRDAKAVLSQDPCGGPAHPCNLHGPPRLAIFLSWPPFWQYSRPG